MFKNRIVLISILMLALTFSGCFGGSALKDLVISPSAEKVEQGKSIELEVKGLNKKKEEVKISNPKWSLSDDEKGTLKEDGTKAVFTADEKATGKVDISVTSGKVSQKVTIEIVVAAKEPDPIDKKDLASAINEAEALLTDTGKGEEPGQAPEEAHTALATAINAAQAIYDNEDATQEDVDAGVIALVAAIQTFNDEIIEEVTGDIIIFKETFNNVPDGTNIRPSAEDKRTETLDNPDSLPRSNVGGTIRVNGGILEVGTQRPAFIIPGLAEATNPVLKLIIKNDNGNGEPVEGLMLYLGNSYSTSGNVGEAGQRAYGNHAITNSNFETLEFILDKEFIDTETISIRPTVGGSGAAGLFIDEIIIVDIK